MRRLAALAFAVSAACASAVETPAWPPSGDVAARMRELQSVIMGAESTAAQRESAREELSGLLKSPAGQARGRMPGERPAPRAAIEPIGPIVKPAVNPPIHIPAAGVATLEVVPPPPRITITPQTGSVAAPAGRGAIDPRTGRLLHEVPNGYVDPRTGQFTPR